MRVYFFKSRRGSEQGGGAGGVLVRERRVSLSFAMTSVISLVSW